MTEPYDPPHGGNPNHLSLDYRARNLMARNAAVAEGRKLPLWVDKPATMHRVQRVWELRVQGLHPTAIAREVGVPVRTVYSDLDRARDLRAYTMAGEMWDSIQTQIERHRSAQRALWQELEMLATSAIPVAEREQAIAEGRPLRRWTTSYPQRAMAVAKLVEDITAIEVKIEELIGLRSRAGTPDYGALRALPGGEDLGDSKVVFNFDFRTQTIKHVSPGT